LNVTLDANPNFGNPRKPFSIDFMESKNSILPITNAAPPKWNLLERSFLEQPPELVAPLLLGKILASQTNSGWLAGRIVEVEAYFGPHTQIPDPAAHSFRGITQRNAVMFGPPGHAYVYFIYGVHYCVNVTCEPEGMAGCILIRALEPILGREQMAANRNLPNSTSDANLTAGPGRLCQAMAITRSSHNGIDLINSNSPLQLLDSGFTYPHSVEISPRIGIRQAAELPLRFSVSRHPCVSRAATRKSSM